MWKTSWQLLGKYKTVSVLALVLSVGREIPMVFFPFLIAQLIDQGIVPKDIGKIYFYALLSFGCLLLSLLLMIINQLVIARSSAGLAYNLRNHLLAKIHQLDLLSVNKFSPASLVIRITSDIETIANAYGLVLSFSLRMPTILITALCLAFAINGQLSLIYLALIPIIALCLLILIRFAYPLYRQLLKNIDKLVLLVEQNLKGMQLVKSCRQEHQEIKKFNRSSAKLNRLFLRVNRLAMVIDPLLSITIDACTLALIWFGLHLIAKGSFSIGGLISLMTYTGYILMSLVMLASMMVTLVQARASIKRLSEVLSEPVLINSSPHPSTCFADNGVEFQDVSFALSAREKYILKSLRFKVKPGEMVAIIGSTGSGKSTLLHLLPRLFEASAGSVRLGGIDVKNYQLSSLRQQVILLPQNHTLFAGTIESNLRLGNPNARKVDLVKACKLACIHQFIKSLPAGYQTKVNEGGSNFSGGQKQRLCLARSLLAKPKILLLDDATASVDSKTQKIIYHHLLNDLPQVTKIVVVGQLAVLPKDTPLLVLDEGRLSAFGIHAQLLKSSPIYQEIYQSQQLKKSYV